jgi:hypothetical protein
VTEEICAKIKKKILQLLDCGQDAGTVSPSLYIAILRSDVQRDVSSGTKLLRPVLDYVTSI